MLLHVAASILGLLQLSAATAASNSSQLVLTVPFYGYDNTPIDASIVDVSNQATTMALQCAPGTNQDRCGLFPLQTLTYGPSTWHMFESAPHQFIGTQDCTQDGTTAAVCVISNGGKGANFPGSSTKTFHQGQITTMPITVTAGATKLSATAAGTPSSTTAGASPASGTSSSNPSSTSSSAASLNVAGSFKASAVSLAILSYFAISLY